MRTLVQKLIAPVLTGSEIVTTMRFAQKAASRAYIPKDRNAARHFLWT